MAYAGKKLKAASSQVKVYFDAGALGLALALGDGLAAGPADIANSADGISSNVSNYRTSANR